VCALQFGKHQIEEIGELMAIAANLGVSIESPAS
jgi:hypothetical protein